MAKKMKIVINSQENLREILQIAYDEADSQMIQAQNEINKLANSTRLQEEVMEAKTKYAKAINDYLGMKDKAISKKIEIAKLLAEITKASNSNQNGEIDTSFGSFNFDNIRDILDNESNKVEEIKLNK